MDHWWIDINLRGTKIYLEEAEEPEMRAPPQSYKCITFNGSYWCAPCGERRDKNGLQKARFRVVHSAFTGITTHMYSASHRAITFSPTFPNWKSGRQIIAHNQFPMSINLKVLNDQWILILSMTWPQRCSKVFWKTVKRQM